MWNPLIDVEENERVQEERGFWGSWKKYKNIIYIFIAIFIIYILVIIYYEKNEKWVDQNIDCKILNDECKNFDYVNFNPDKLYLVDVNLENNNFIMRSNVPIFDGKYSKKLLLNEIKKKIQESNLKFYDNYNIYIFSLLNDNIKEKCYVVSEKCYADDSIIDRQPIFGSSSDPYDFPEKDLDIKLKSLSWNTDDLINKVKNLHDKFMRMKNTIFLIHCKGGKDRTGEYVGAYRMFIKRNSLKNVMFANQALGLLKPNNVNMQKWFCLYLENVLKYSELNCYDYKLNYNDID